MRFCLQKKKRNEVQGKHEVGRNVSIRNEKFNAKFKILVRSDLTVSALEVVVVGCRVDVTFVAHVFDGVLHVSAIHTAANLS